MNLTKAKYTMLVITLTIISTVYAMLYVGVAELFPQLETAIAVLQVKSIVSGMFAALSLVALPFVLGSGLR